MPSSDPQDGFVLSYPQTHDRFQKISSIRIPVMDQNYVCSLIFLIRHIFDHIMMRFEPKLSFTAYNVIMSCH